MATLSTLFGGGNLATSNDTYESFTADTTETLSFAFDNVPANFLSMDTLTLAVEASLAIVPDNDTYTFTAKISNGGTDYTDTISFGDVTSNTDSTFGPTAFTLTAAGLSATQAEWNAATLDLIQTHGQTKGGDGNNIRVDLAQLDGTYTESIQASLNVTDAGGDSANIQGELGRIGSLSVTDAGGDSASGSADVIATASLAPTDAGGDSANIQGELGRIADLIATDAGGDSANIIASLIVDPTASLDATEGFSDSFVQTNATVAVDASLDATGPSDSAGITAEVSNNASLDATDAGGDTSSITSEVPVDASLDATDAGGDTGGISGEVAVSSSLNTTEGFSDSSQITASVLVDRNASLDATDSGGDIAFSYGRTTPYNYHVNLPPNIAGYFVEV